MALHWSIARVKDWKEIAENPEQRVITEAVVWAALVYDPSGVTEKNIDEWLFRQEFARRVNGYQPLYHGIEPSVFTPRRARASDRSLDQRHDNQSCRLPKEDDRQGRQRRQTRPQRIAPLTPLSAAAGGGVGVRSIPLRGQFQ
jgi:hypothetical protein